MENLYIIAAKVKGEERPVYTLSRILDDLSTAEPVIVKNSPEELATAIYETFLESSKGVGVSPVGSNYIGSPKNFPKTGFINDKLADFFEMDESELARHENSFIALMRL